MSTYISYSKNGKKREQRRYDMPWGLLIFIAGLVVYFVTEFNTLGVILMAVGGGIFLLGVLFFVAVLIGVVKMNKSVRRW